MIVSVGRFVACLAVAGLVTACAQLAAFQTPDTTDRQQQAEALIEKGDLAEALVQLRVLETLRPNDPDIARLRSSVEAQIKREAENRYEKAEAADRRNRREAFDDYVAVLEIDPQHESALRRLRQLELRQNRSDRPRVSGPEAPTKMAESELPAPMEAPMAGPVVASRQPPHDVPKPTPKPAPAAAPSPAAAGAPGKSDGSRAVVAPTSAENRTPGNSDKKEIVAMRPPVADGAAGETGARDSVAMPQSVDEAVDVAKAGTYLNLIAYAESYLADHPGDDHAVELLALSHEKAGLALYHDGKLRQSLRHLEFAVKYSGDTSGPPAVALAAAKSQLAEETFELGVRAFRKDISQAIAYWEETLTYDPGHAKAKLFLSKAYRIRDTLNEISGP